MNRALPQLEITLTVSLSKDDCKMMLISRVWNLRNNAEQSNLTEMRWGMVSVHFNAT